METQVLGVKPRKPFKNSFPEITGRREQPPYYIDFNFPASTKRRLRPEGSCHSLVFQLQPKGGYDLLSLPRPTTLVRTDCWTCGPVTHQTLNLLLITSTFTSLSSHITGTHCSCTSLYTSSYTITEQVILLCFHWTQGMHHLHRVCIIITSMYNNTQVCTIIINM